MAAAEGPFRWATGIEDTFIAQSTPLQRPLDEYDLQQHYRFWREDLDLAGWLGVSTMRYGIPWHKVNPAPGAFDWSWTDQVLEYMVRDLHIEPIVDLIHYGAPLWIEGTFDNPGYPEYVAAYARAFAERYRALGVRCFTPCNEPFIHAVRCGLLGAWPPWLTGDEGLVRLLNQLSKGIIRTVQNVREVCPEAVFVHVESAAHQSSAEEGQKARAAFIMERQHTMFELVQGRVADGHPLHAYLVQYGVTSADLQWYRQNAIALDVLGLNYYPESTATERVTGPDGKVRTVPVWGGGEKLKALARDWYARHGRPIFMTETSTNGKAAARQAWLEESVQAVSDLRAEGVPVIGYTWWPLYDLVGWDYREGSGPVEKYLAPMGLWQLEPGAGGTLQRRRLPVAERYREMIAEGIKQPRR